MNESPVNREPMIENEPRLKRAPYKESETLTEMNMERHPLSAAFPDMDEEDFEDLLSSIKQHGQREPITIFENQVLDGWHRYRACEQLGIGPMTMEFEGKDPVSYVIDLNLNRRHLSPSQKALAVVTCSTWSTDGRPKNTPYESTKTVPRGTVSKTSDEMAKEAGVGKRTINRAKEVVTKGDKDTIEKVKKGAMSLSEALRSLDKADPSNAPPKPVEPRLPAAISIEKYQELFKQHEALKALYQEQQDNAEELAKELEILEAIRDSEHYPKMREMQATIDNLTQSRDKWQAECAEMKKQVLYWKRHADRKSA